jgi:hypothetical protein
VSVRKLIIALLAGLVLLLSPAAALAAGPYPPPSGGGSGHVDESRVEAGDCVIFTGSGFAPFTEVTITDNGEFVGTTTTNSKGEFSYTVCFGADVRTGRHVLAGSGLGADGRPLRVTVTVFVTGVRQRPGPGTQGQPAGFPRPTAQPSSSATPSTTTSAEPTPEPTSVPHGGPSANGNDDGSSISGLATAGIVVGLVLLLALLALLLLLAERRRRDDADGGAPA